MMTSEEAIQRIADRQYRLLQVAHIIYSGDEAVSLKDHVAATWYLQDTTAKQTPFEEWRKNSEQSQSSR